MHVLRNLHLMRLLWSLDYTLENGKRGVDLSIKLDGPTPAGCILTDFNYNTRTVSDSTIIPRDWSIITSALNYSIPE